MLFVNGSEELGSEFSKAGDCAPRMNANHNVSTAQARSNEFQSQRFIAAADLVSGVSLANSTSDDESEARRMGNVCCFHVKYTGWTVDSFSCAHNSPVVIARDNAMLWRQHGRWLA